VRYAIKPVVTIIESPPTIIFRRLSFSILFISFHFNLGQALLKATQKSRQDGNHTLCFITHTHFIFSSHKLIIPTSFYVFLFLDAHSFWYSHSNGTSLSGASTNVFIWARVEPSTIRSVNNEWTKRATSSEVDRIPPAEKALSPMTCEILLDSFCRDEGAFRRSR